MPSAKIVITMDEIPVEQLDRFVAKSVFPNRSRAIQEAVKEKTIA